MTVISSESSALLAHRLELSLTHGQVRSLSGKCGVTVEIEVAADPSGRGRGEARSMPARSSLRPACAFPRTRETFFLSASSWSSGVELELAGAASPRSWAISTRSVAMVFLLADDGFLEEKSGLLEGVNVPDLLQPWHAQ